MRHAAIEPAPGDNGKPSTATPVTAMPAPATLSNTMATEPRRSVASLPPARPALEPVPPGPAAAPPATQLVPGPKSATPGPVPGTTASAPAQVAAPLPPVRPFQAMERERVAALPPPKVMGAETDQPASEEEATAPAVPTICPELSNDNLGVFAPVTVTATQTACTVDRGVSLSAVRMKDGRLVQLDPPAVLRCEMAGAVAKWLRESVDPLVATLGSPLDKVKVAASQQCRSRNRVAGAKISEHGRGNALDTAGYVLEDKREILIGGTGDTAMTPDFQQRLKASACADFTTILGPGSDGYHEKHLHVDRAERRSGAVLCQWAVSTGKGR